MLFRKITEGYVVQVFNDEGLPLAQRFIAGDDCEYETGEGDEINVEDMPLAGNEYMTYDMVQPDLPLEVAQSDALVEALAR